LEGARSLAEHKQDGGCGRSVIEREVVAVDGNVVGIAVVDTAAAAAGAAGANVVGTKADTAVA